MRAMAVILLAALALGALAPCAQAACSQGRSRTCCNAGCCCREAGQKAPEPKPTPPASRDGALAQVPPVGVFALHAGSDPTYAIAPASAPARSLGLPVYITACAIRC